MPPEDIQNWLNIWGSFAAPFICGIDPASATEFIGVSSRGLDGVIYESIQNELSMQCVVDQWLDLDVNTIKVNSDIEFIRLRELNF